MREKEKAIELFNKFRKYSYTNISRESEDRYIEDCQKMRSNTKESINVCINEIIENNRNVLTPEEYHTELNFWEAVRKEADFI